MEAMHRATYGEGTRASMPLKWMELWPRMENTRWPGSQVKTRWAEGTWKKLTAKMSTLLQSPLENTEVADFIS